MTNDSSKFEGMTLAKLDALDERMTEVLQHVRCIEDRCLASQALHATLQAEMRAVREKTNFHGRVIWGAVAWIVVSALTTLLVALGMQK